MKFKKTIGNLTATLGLVAILTGCATSTQATAPTLETVEEAKTAETIENKKFYTLICYDKDNNKKYEAYQLTDGENALPIEYLPKELSYEQVLKIVEGQKKNISGVMVINN